MSETETKTIRATATRNFKDAGTERNFEAGKPFDLTEGEFANFKAAGLVELVADAPADAGETSTKPRTRS